MSCESFRRQLGTMNAGSLASEDHAALAAHLGGCAGCRAEREMIAALGEARAAAATPMNHLRQERIFRQTRTALGNLADDRSLSAPWRSRMITLVAAVAVGAAALLFWLKPTAPPIAEGRWLTHAGGVHAWLQGDADATVTFAGDEASISLTKGAVLVHFDRTKASGPLVVRTGEAEVWVRGTVFYVEVTPEPRTRVGVHHGRVEVRSGRGSTSVGAGEAAEADPTQVRTVQMDPKRMEELGSQFRLRQPQQPVVTPLDEPTDPEQAPEEAQDPDPVPGDPGIDDPVAVPGRAPHERRSRPAERAPAQTPTAGSAVGGNTGKGDAPDADPLAQAADLARQGSHAEANRILRAALAAGQLSAHDREEALYLLSTGLRAQQQYQQAADILRELSGSSDSRAARLALLERARLLAYQLGKPADAQALLDRFARSERTDALSQEAAIESCVIRLERGARDDAHDCLREFLTRYPGHHGHEKVRALERRLKALR